MSKEKSYDPFEGFKQISEMWERQINGLVYRATDNKEFVRFAKTGLDIHSRYMELLRKNQELMAGLMNIPTKKDVANVAKLSVQAEEKIDLLEEQIWNLQESIGVLNKENLELFQEMVKMIKQMKEEFQKTVYEVTNLKGLKNEFQELRKGLVDIKIIQVNLQDIRKELEEIKASQVEIIGMYNQEKEDIIHTDLQEVKLGLNQLNEIKSDMDSLKGLIKKVTPKGKEKELVASK